MEGEMKRILVAALTVMLAGIFTSCMKYEKIEYDESGVPAIKNLPRQKMILAGARGTPGKISGDCIGSLFNMFFSMNYKGKVMAAPRARWPILPETTENEWVGIFGLPVPEEVTTLPVLKKKNTVEVKIGYWEYGETAEITHVGGYDKEQPSVDRLQKFIKDSGYEIAGPHEEVYIKGPGMFGKGDPSKYVTLIRYQVKKAAKTGKKVNIR